MYLTHARYDPSELCLQVSQDCSNKILHLIKCHNVNQFYWLEVEFVFSCFLRQLHLS